MLRLKQILGSLLIGVSGLSCTTGKKIPESFMQMRLEEYNKMQEELVSLREEKTACGDALFQFQFDEAFGNTVRVPSALPAEEGAQ